MGPKARHSDITKVSITNLYSSRKGDDISNKVGNFGGDIIMIAKFIVIQNIFHIAIGRHDCLCSLCLFRLRSTKCGW